MAERAAKKAKTGAADKADKAGKADEAGKISKNAPNLDLAMIGNCSFSALIDRNGRIVWCCIPRFDGDPVFCSLLTKEQPWGFYEITIEDFERSEQTYVGNTAIVKTLLYDRNGSAVEVTDFAPRFKQFGRIFRPIQLVRQVRVAAGTPRIKCVVRPRYGYGAHAPTVTRGTNHVRYVLEESTVRLTTDIPISYILEELPFIMMEESYTIIIGPDESMRSAPSEVGRVFYEHTHDYWKDWTRSLAIPFEYQVPVIRAAIALQLCSFEETGSIVAAMTTSIPEAPNTERCWDYRASWLRDSFFTVQALNRLGETNVMSSFLAYISNIVASSPEGTLQPVYGITMGARLEERFESHLDGYRGYGPVRVGNDAYRQVQHDVYGSVILACAQLFFDERMSVKGDEALFRRLEKLGDKAALVYDQPDAGIWELRTIANVHTFSSLLCWAACDRLSRIAKRINLDSDEKKWAKKAAHIKGVIDANAFDTKRNTYVSTFGGQDVDACLLLLEELGYVEGSDPRFVGTVEAIEKDLRKGDFMMRYAVKDDFGYMESAFNICSFWLIDALNAIGRKDEARRLFDKMLSVRNHAGLMSEDLDIDTGELWGNFPQTYSLVGLINCALNLSRPWRGAF